MNGFGQTKSPHPKKRKKVKILQQLPFSRYIRHRNDWFRAQYALYALTGLTARKKSVRLTHTITPLAFSPTSLPLFPHQHHFYPSSLPFPALPFTSKSIFPKSLSFQDRRLSFYFSSLMASSTEGLVPITRTFLSRYYDKYPFTPLCDDVSRLSSELRAMAEDLLKESPATSSTSSSSHFNFFFIEDCIFFPFFDCLVSCFSRIVGLSVDQRSTVLSNKVGFWQEKWIGSVLGKL